MSERFLSRRLTQNGKTYRGLVDSVRQNMCRSYMRQGRPLTEIALILGFNDQSAFTRAFKKWYGTAPSQFKALEISI